MRTRHLANYLNNHLAGSVTAIQLLGYLAESYAGTDVEPFATALRDEIVADQSILESLMSNLQIPKSAPRMAAAWVGEKFAQLKLRLDDMTDGSLRLLEATEALSIGIEGKRLLWYSLQAVAESAPALQALDLPGLISNAEQQRAKVEQVRLTAARTALPM